MKRVISEVFVRLGMLLLLAGVASAATPTQTPIFGYAPGAASQLQFKIGGTWYMLSAACAAHNWYQTTDANGQLTCTQPGFSDLSGAIAAGQLITPGGATLGAVYSSTAAAHNFATGVNTSGAVTYAQPAFSDISGSVTAGQMPAFTGGDCTTSAGSVALNCTKTGGASFGYFATGTSAANLTGTLPAAQLPAFSGDATTSAGSSVVSVTKTGGVAFAPSATTDTTNATNITSGTLPLSVIPTSILGGSGAPGSVYATSTAGVATGLSYASKVAGSGGTNGTYNVTIPSTGAGTSAVVQVIIASGSISGTPSVTTGGSNFTSVQTITNAMLVSAGATGLTGASVTLNPGGGVAFGSYYWVISASTTGVVDLWLNVSGTATAQGKTIADGGILSSVSVGLSSPVSTGNISTANTTYILPTAAAYNGYVTSASIYSGGAGPAKILVVTNNGDGTVSLVSSTNVMLTAGLNTLSLHIPIAAGQNVGFYSNSTGAVEYSTVSSTVWYFTGFPASHTAYTVAGTITLEMGFTFDGQISGDVAYHDSAISALQSSVGYLNTYGVTTSGSGSGSSGTGYTYFTNAPATQSGYVTQVQIGVTTAQTGLLYVATDNGNGTVTVTSQTSVALSAGNNIVNGLSVPIAVGQIVGWWLPSGGLYYVIGTGAVYYYAAQPTVGTPFSQSSTGAYYLQTGWTITNGLEQSVFNLQNASDPIGINALSSADPTGVSDATSIFATALATFPNPYVRAGSAYSVTSLPLAGYGLWGPGGVFMNGVRLALPQSPIGGSQYLRLRAALMSQIYNGAALAIVGDSITNGYAASADKNDWVPLLTRFVNMGIAIDNPVESNFDASDTSGGPSFHGLTISGSVINGTNGPVSKSLMLQAGQTVTFTGAYDSIDVTYQRAATGGPLTFAYNGSTYKTVTTTGSAANDVYSGTSATGQTASGTYVITNTGSVAVEITSIIRFGVKTGGTPPRLIVCRFAHGGYAFSSYMSAQVVSMNRIATAIGGGTKPFVLTALGTNDSLSGSSYATIYANATAYIGLWTALGIPVRSMAGVGLWRWGSYPSGSYEVGEAAIRDAYGDAGITRIIKTDGIDFVGLYGGDGHPPDAGHALEFNTVVDGLTQ